MPIEFHCKSCSSRIEVDDEHAGGKAICPFCQTINSVPKGSEPPITARPAEHTPDVPVSNPPKRGKSTPSFESEPGIFDAGRAGLPTPPPATLRRTRLGMLGLAGAILSIVLMVVPVVLGFRHLPAPLKQQFWQMQDMTPQQRQEFQKQATEELVKIAQDRPLLGGLPSLGLLLWIVSLAMNISMIFSTGMHRRTSAWAGLGINTIVLFACLCSGMIQRLAGS